MRIALAACLLLCTAACSADAGEGLAVHAAGSGGRRVLQQAKQEAWWNAVLDSTSSSQDTSQQSWWMDLMTKVATSAQLFETNSETPTSAPTAAPTAEPTAQPTREPTAEPTREPTAEPTKEPTAEPTKEPTAEPTKEPTAEPTKEPTATPTKEPTSQPTAATTGSSSGQSIAEEQRSLTEYELKVQKQATAPSDQAMECKPDGDGGTLCGIPIGYDDGMGGLVYNRTGYYYLPKTYKDGPLPVLILLHGSGVNGNWMLQSLPFKEAADKAQVIVVAPDSKYDMYWFSPAASYAGFTHDWFHIEACYNWVATKNPQGAQFDEKRVSLAGNSRAGYVGPPFCSRSKVVPCSSTTIMHAAANAVEMGDKVIPILWTAGVRDPLYGPDVTQDNIKKFEAELPQFPIYYSLWDSGHALSKSQEIDYIVEWGANPDFWGTPAPPIGSYRRRLESSPAELQR